MFTGIVQKKVQVASYDKGNEIGILTLNCDGLSIETDEIGASIAVNGVCLTLTQFDDSSMQFDVVRSTMDKTNLHALTNGNFVNIEKSLITGDANSGHEVSGHVDGMGTIHKKDVVGESHRIQIKLPSHLMRYIFAQGFIALNGISLTISDIDKDNHIFEIWVIPETARMTNICDLNIGDSINVEIEKRTQIMVDTIRDTVKDYLDSSDNEKMNHLVEVLK
jgi:riboflavin synthase